MNKLTPEQLLELADNFHDRVFSINQTQQLFDHIKALESEVADREYAYKAYKTMYTGHSERIKEKDDRIQALEAENARYKEALKQYADHGNWVERNDNQYCVSDHFLTLNHEDGWEVAEKALKGDQ